MKILSVDKIAATPWIELKKSRYLNKKDVESEWDFVSRTHGKKVVTIIGTSMQTGKILVISQPRVPVAREVFEFPAGLIDGDESPSVAAIRELREETGYSGQISAIHSPVAKSPGLTDEQTYIVEILIDESQRKEMTPEDSEDITIYWFTDEDFWQLVKNHEPETVMVDTQLYFYFLGRKNRK